VSYLCIVNREGKVKSGLCVGWKSDVVPRPSSHCNVTQRVIRNCADLFKGRREEVGILDTEEGLDHEMSGGGCTYLMGRAKLILMSELLTSIFGVSVRSRSIGGLHATYRTAVGRWANTSKADIRGSQPLQGHECRAFRCGRVRHTMAIESAIAIITKRTDMIEQQQNLPMQLPRPPYKICRKNNRKILSVNRNTLVHRFPCSPCLHSRRSPVSLYKTPVMSGQPKNDNKKAYLGGTPNDARVFLFSTLDE
jgi:hypothetical protein